MHAKVRKYLEVLRPIYNRRWVKWTLLVWAVIGIYDQFVSQLLPPALAEKAPRVYQVLTMTGELITWQGWLMVAVAAVFIIGLEYAVRQEARIRRLTAQQTAGAGKSTLGSAIQTAGAKNPLVTLDEAWVDGVNFRNQMAGKPIVSHGDQLKISTFENLFITEVGKVSPSEVGKFRVLGDYKWDDHPGEVQPPQRAGDDTLIIFSERLRRVRKFVDDHSAPSRSDRYLVYGTFGLAAGLALAAAIYFFLHRPGSLGPSVSRALLQISDPVRERQPDGNFHYRGTAETVSNTVRSGIVVRFAGDDLIDAEVRGLTNAFRGKCNYPSGVGVIACYIPSPNGLYELVLLKKSRSSAALSYKYDGEDSVEGPKW